MTLARTRLYLGITAVGLTVLLAAVALWSDLPSAWLSDDTTVPVARTVATALVWPLVWTALLFPLDVLGGTVAVRHRPAIWRWLWPWVRGVLTQLVVLAIAGMVLVALSRALGLFGAVTGATLTAAAIVSQTGRLARLGASVESVPTDATAQVLGDLGDFRMEVVATRDEAFVGGFTGLVQPRLLVPETWLALPRDVLQGVLVRRQLAAATPRVRGIALALVWLALGATVSGHVAGLPDSAAGLVRFSLATTLWSFLGVLVLPTPSRRAVVALDQRAARVVGAGPIREGIIALDRWQDDEPARNRLVETIFHPVPSRTSRITSLSGSTPAASGAWRVARVALPMGLGGWSLLGRAVHCNLGRPALWWMLPGD